MKRILLLIVCVGIAPALMAQQEVLFGEKARVTGFGGPIVEFSSYDNEFGVSVGGGGALQVNNFFFGGYGLGLSTPLKRNFGGIDYSVNFGHGGFWIGYHSNEKLVHFTASMKTGWGGVVLIERYSDFEPADQEIDNVFVLTPEAGVEVNLTHFMRVSGTVGYRAVTGLDMSGFEKQAMNSFIGTLVFKFGGFRKLGN